MKDVKILTPDDMGEGIKFNPTTKKFDVDTPASDSSAPQFDSSLTTNGQGKLTVMGERSDVTNKNTETLAVPLHDRVYAITRGLLQVGESDIYVPFSQSMDLRKVFAFADENIFDWHNLAYVAVKILPLGDYFDGKESVDMVVVDGDDDVVLHSDHYITVHLRDGQLVMEGGDEANLANRLVIDGNIIYPKQGEHLYTAEDEKYLITHFPTAADIRRAFLGE